jgi:ribonuclease-3
MVNSVLSSIREKLKRWSKSLRPVQKSAQISKSRVRLLEDLEEIIGYTFRDKDLLNRSLSHRSYAHDNGKGIRGSYERLEFLGDAVLGMIVSEELFKAYPDLMEGDLTKIKSSLVSRSTLARCSNMMKLERYLLITGGMDLLTGKSKGTILADSFEAVLGAMYLDGGLEVVNRFINRILMSSKDSITSEQILHSTKSNLLQLSQERFRSQPTYKVVKTTGPEHNKIFTCEVEVAGRRLGRGRGSSKKEAEKVAALNALRKLSPELTGGTLHYKKAGL